MLEYSQKLQLANLAFKCDCSNALSFSDVLFIISFLKLWLQILPPNMTAQFFVVFEITFL